MLLKLFVSLLLLAVGAQYAAQWRARFTPPPVVEPDVQFLWWHKQACWFDGDTGQNLGGLCPRVEQDI